MEHDQCQACVDVTLLPFHRGGGGAGEGREGTATRRLVVAMFNHALTEKWTIGNVPINAPHPNINMHILHTVLYTFPRVLTRGTCLTIKTSSSW